MSVTHKPISRRRFISSVAAAGAVLLASLPSASAQAHPSHSTLSLFDKLMEPFQAEAGKRRERRNGDDPEYASRIDIELNSRRLNFLLFGFGEFYGENHGEVSVIGSHTIFSYDLGRREVDVVSITHDARAPEIERFLSEQGEIGVRPIRIEQAYHLPGGGQAGFDLQRKVLESATGLSVDFQLVFGDDAIVDLVDTVFGGIKVVSPRTFYAWEFPFQGTWYPATVFPEGIQEMDGVRTLQFIKGSAPLAHNNRKPPVVAGMLEALQSNSLDPRFWKRMIDFVNRAHQTKQIAYDFDPVSLVANNIWGLGANLVRSPFDRTEMSLMPKTGRTVYIGDPDSGGDGGLRWAKGDQNPVIKEEWDRGYYIDPNMQVPLNGDPYSMDLPRYYWRPVRKKIREMIAG